MSDVLKTSRRWLGAWVFPLALLALPNCLLDAGPFQGAGDPKLAFDPGPLPNSSAIMCDIPLPNQAGAGDGDCATQEDLDNGGMSMSEAAIALNESQTNGVVFDFSKASTDACGGFPKKFTYEGGSFPKGLTVCLNCGIQMPDPYANPAKACIAKCKDVIGSISDGTIDEVAYCNSWATTSTNFDATKCYDGACTDNGNPKLPPDFVDPRIHPEPVQWTDLSGTDDFGGSNSLKRIAPTTGIMDSDFNAGAASVQIIQNGDAWVEFQAGQNDVSHVLSLRESCAKALDCPDADPTLDNIGFALSLNNDNRVYVLEKKKGAPLEFFGPFGDLYTPEQRFRVHAKDNNDGTATITYTRLTAACEDGKKCEEVELYKSLAPSPSYPLQIDTTFREVDATLNKVTVLRIIKP